MCVCVSWICLIPPSNQERTQDEKSAEDRQLWNVWLDSYTERLQQEVTGVTDLSQWQKERVTVMNATNPRYGNMGQHRSRLSGYYEIIDWKSGW